MRVVTPLLLLSVIVHRRLQLKLESAAMWIVLSPPRSDEVAVLRIGSVAGMARALLAEDHRDARVPVLVVRHSRPELPN